MKESDVTVNLKKKYFEKLPVFVSGINYYLDYVKETHTHIVRFMKKKEKVTNIPRC